VDTYKVCTPIGYVYPAHGLPKYSGYMLDLQRSKLVKVSKSEEWEVSVEFRDRAER